MITRNKTKTAALKALLNSYAFTIADALKLLSEGADPSTQDDAEEEAVLHRLLNTNKNFSLPFLKKFVADYQVDTHQQDKFGRTALHYAAGNGNLAVVEWLVREQKADVHAKTSLSGGTPLFYACANGHLACAQFLVSQGARLTDKNNDNQTLLHAATTSQDESTVQWLVDSGQIDVSVKDSANQTIRDINKPLVEKTTIHASSPARLNVFKKNHAMSLEHSGIFKAIKRFFSKMRDLLLNKKSIQTIADVNLYAQNNPKSRTAHILTVMNSKMTFKEFKQAYEEARSKKFFNNPFEMTMQNALKTQDPSYDMEKVKDHAMNRPDSLTAQVIKSYRVP